MIRVTVEILPHGDPHRAETLEVLTICNRGPVTEDLARDPGGERWYQVDHLRPAERGPILRTTEMVVHPRRDGVLELVRRSLEVLR